MGIFKTVIKSLRTSHGLTQDELSKQLGISRSTIGMYESGAREPDFETLELIADYFNVDTDFLLGRTSQTTLLPETIGAYSKTRELTAVYEQLSPHNQGKVLTYSKSLLSTQQMEEDVLAAHARTDVEQTSEGVQHDLDIMNDDSMWD